MVGHGDCNHCGTESHEVYQQMHACPCVSASLRGRPRNATYTARIQELPAMRSVDILTRRTIVVPLMGTVQIPVLPCDRLGSQLMGKCPKRPCERQNEHHLAVSNIAAHQWPESAERTKRQTMVRCCGMANNVNCKISGAIGSE